MARSRRPFLIFFLALLDVVAGLCGGTLAVGLVRELVSGKGDPYGALIMILAGALALGFFVAAYSLLFLKPHGRTLQMGLSLLGLICIPFGTLASILTYVYFTRPGVMALYGEPVGGFSHGLSLRDEAPAAPPEPPPWYSVLSLSLVASILLAIGFVLLISVPSLLRARVVANEAAAIGSLHTVLSAEVAYSDHNGGHYDTLECLAEPRRCIPGYPKEAPSTFLEVSYLRTQRSGYLFTFHPGPAPADRTAQTSPSSLAAFAYLAVPATPRSGGRSFCADGTGKICFTNGAPPSVHAGECPADCPMLP